MTDEILLKRMLDDKKTTRREFLVGATALGLSAAAASTMWSKTANAAPTKGGHLRSALVGGSTTDNLDQQSWTDTFMIAVGRATRDSLVEVGQDNTAQPGLAESWEASADASTWRFKLRSGVEFSNGKSLTTEDVIASINVHRGDETTSGAKGVFEAIEDVTADGDVVAVKLKGPNADFPFLMTDYHMNIVPAPDGKPNLTDGIGTGLYKLTQFEPGVRAAPVEQIQLAGDPPVVGDPHETVIVSWSTAVAATDVGTPGATTGAALVVLDTCTQLLLPPALVARTRKS